LGLLDELGADAGGVVAFLVVEQGDVLAHQVKHGHRLAVRAGRPALLVTLTVPERIEAGHVAFARQLAQSATAYAVEVERRFRGLPRLADTIKEVA